MLFAMVLSSLFAGSASANFKPYYPPRITLLSPSSNETYKSSSVLLNVSVVIYGIYPGGFDNITFLNYSLDGQQDVPISFSWYAGVYLYAPPITLSGLYSGPHNILVHGESIMNGESILFNASVAFTVGEKTTGNVQENILGLPPLAFSAIAVSVAVAAVVPMAALVYLKKRRH